MTARNVEAGKQEDEMMITKRNTKEKAKLVRVSVPLTEEDFASLKNKIAAGGYWTPAQAAGVLLSNAIRASWAYTYLLARDEKKLAVVGSAQEFFAGLRRLQDEAQRACVTAETVSKEGARRCQQLADALKFRQAFPAAKSKGSKVVKGKFRPAPEPAS